MITKANQVKICCFKKNIGAILIEAVVSVFVFSMVAIAIAGSFTSAVKSVTYTKEKIAAVAISNEQMELLHNLPYDSLATQNGAIYPPGNIADDQTINRAGVNYKVHIDISYFDDPFDGNAAGTVSGKPKDIYPYDYKKVEVRVGISNQPKYLTEFSSNISGKAAETSSNTGILNVCAIDSKNAIVPSAAISVTNSYVIPAVNINTTTDSTSGCVMIPKLPPDSNNHYHVIATKGGFSTDSTYTITAQNPNPSEPDANVLVQKVTDLTFTIDTLSTLNLQLSDQNGVNIPSVTFTLNGTKTIGTSPDVLKYSKSSFADSDGKITIPYLEYDDYNITNLGSNYLVSSSVPIPIHLLANANLSATITLSTSPTNPAIFNITPISGLVNETVTITVNGNNFQSGATASISKIVDGQPKTFSATNIDVLSPKQMTFDVILNNADVGKWNVEVINPNSEKVIFANGFEVKGS